MLKYSFIFMVFVIFSNLTAGDKYNRSEWGNRWEDEDKDCQDTRQEVLIKESLIPVTLSDNGCKVIKGRWICLYTGVIIENPILIDIDHLIPLKEAHESGGDKWSKEEKKKYYNYLDSDEHLIAVHRSANRSKGSKSPDEWMPTFTQYHCSYLKDWISEKSRWGLKMDEKEQSFIVKKLTELKCYAPQ